MAPMQNEIAIRTMRDRCSRKYAARARSRACVVATSAGLAVIATERRSRPVLFASAAYSAHSAQVAKCDSSQAAVRGGDIFHAATGDEIEGAIMLAVGHCAPPLSAGRKAITPR